MDTTGNPVGNLLRYIERAAEVSPTVYAPVGWAYVFECEETDSMSIAQGVLMLRDLEQEARKAIVDNIKGKLDIYLAPLDGVQQMLLKCSFGQQWSHYKQHLTPLMIQGLRFGDHTLDNHYPATNPLVRKNVLAFLDQLDDLLKKCVESDLTDDLKALFIKHLEAIRTSLLDYLSGGLDRVESVADEAIGALARRVPEIDQSSAAGKGLAKKILESLSFANQVIAKTQETATLVSPMVEKLLRLVV